MKRFLILLGLLCFCGGLQAQTKLDISTVHGTAAELQTRAQLEQLAEHYDLSPWIFTRTISIDEQAIPHSHPVLTLHTRHLKDDELLLSTFVHEQLHWYLAQHRKEVDAAILDLRRSYPAIPVGYPQGSNDEDGNYEHLLVIFLEYRADRTLLGELRAGEVMEFWAKDHYTWLYQAVLDHPNEIGTIVRRHHLIPGAAG
jgi:hypothetical protein